jgi:hypothetical protein
MQGGCALNAHAASCRPPDQVVGRTAAAPGVGAVGVQGHATLFFDVHDGEHTVDDIGVELGVADAAREQI